mgnify:CR=1 FL=1
MASREAVLGHSMRTGCPLDGFWPLQCSPLDSGSDTGGDTGGDAGGDTQLGTDHVLAPRVLHHRQVYPPNPLYGVKDIQSREGAWMARSEKVTGYQGDTPPFQPKW